MRHEERKPAPGEGAASFEIRLFGPMEVRVGGMSLPRLRSRKGLWLLALLALRRGALVDRDWLAGTLWPDDDTEDARRSLRQSLHDLRRALGAEGERLESSSRHTVSLDLSGAQLDVAEFDSAMASADPTRLQCGIALRRGRLLEGCTEEWVVPERLTRDQAYVAGLEALASAACAQSDYAAAADWLRRAVTEEPFREDLWRQLMTALDSDGNGIGALAAYRELRDRLWAELTAQPEPETTALYRTVRDELRGRAAEASSRTPPHRPGGARSARPGPGQGDNLPVPLTALIGREDAVRDVGDMLSATRLVTLVGPGGIGKTRLSIEVASRASRSSPDGVRFVDLAALTDPASVADAVRDAVGLPAGAREASAALVDFLRDRSVLVILDNCEHLVESCAAVCSLLLGRCADVRILATSRRALGVRGETIYRTEPLEFPRPTGGPRPPAATELKVDPLSYPAVRLFAERAHAADGRFRLDAHNAEAVTEICRRLDGIPLAIELAAARTRSLPVSHIRDRLGASLGLPADRALPQLARQQTLATTFDWSWNLLTPAEQVLLRRLAVFAGGWTISSAEAVCAAGELPVAEVAPLLGSLVDASLVVFAPRGPGLDGPSEASQEDRYHLLETIRQFAVKRLEAAGEATVTRRRHRDFLLNWAERLNATRNGSNQASQFALLEAEHDNLRAALDWTSAEGEAEELLRMSVAISPFWDTRGYLREGRARLEAAIASAPFGPQSWAYFAALGQIGWIAYLQGDPAARLYLRQVLAYCRASNDGIGLPRILNMAALAAEQAGDYDEARTLFLEAMKRSVELEPPGPVATVLDNLGCLELRLGNLAAARSYIEECVSQCAQQGAASQMHGVSLFDLAVVDVQQGRVDTGWKHAMESLHRLHDCAASVCEPDAVSALALAACARRDWADGALLMGAAHDLRMSTGACVSSLIAEAVDSALAEMRQVMGDRAFDEAFDSGRGLQVDEILARFSDRGRDV